MTTMIISAHHTSPDGSTKQYIEEMSAKLSRYFRRILTIQWDFHREGPRYLATCRVHAQSGFYRIRVAADSLRRAIHDAEEALTRQRRRRKALRKKIRSRSGNRWAKSSWPPRFEQSNESTALFD